MFDSRVGDECGLVVPVRATLEVQHFGHRPGMTAHGRAQGVEQLRTELRQVNRRQRRRDVVVSSDRTDRRRHTAPGSVEHRPEGVQIGAVVLRGSGARLEFVRHVRDVVHFDGRPHGGIGRFLGEIDSGLGLAVGVLTSFDVAVGGALGQPFLRELPRRPGPSAVSATARCSFDSSASLSSGGRLFTAT